MSGHCVFKSAVFTCMNVGRDSEGWKLCTLFWKKSQKETDTAILKGGCDGHFSFV